MKARARKQQQRLVGKREKDNIPTERIHATRTTTHPESPRRTILSVFFRGVAIFKDDD
jgi:hypothetical protein